MKTERLTTHWQQLPERAVRRLQAAKLRRFLKSVVLPFSPHYREMFSRHGIRPDAIKCLQDLDGIPFTSKEDLLNTPEQPNRGLDFLVVPDVKVLSKRLSSIAQALLFGRESVRQQFDAEFRPVFLTSTTGRSADPIPFLYTRHDLDNLASAGDRVMQVCGADQSFRLINMFPYAPHLAFWLTHYASTAFGIFTVGTGGGKVLGTEGNLRLIRKLSPHGFIGMPTFLYHLMQQAVEEGMRCPNLKKVVLGGEKVASGMRRKLRKLAAKLGAPDIDVLATYGFTEAKVAWAECPHPAGRDSSGYHLYPDLGFFEVIDPDTGLSLPPGHPGELVYTPLDARGTVVLRYRTGDIIDGGLVYDPCPYCGRTVPRLVGRISRSSEVRSMNLDKIKGTLVDFNQLEHVLDDAPHVNAWQLELRKVNDDPLDLDELILHVNKSGRVSRDRLERDLSERVVERTEIRPNRIVFHNAEELRHMLGIGVQLKEQRIIDNRPGHAPRNEVAGNGSAANHGSPSTGDPGPVETMRSGRVRVPAEEVTT